MARMPGAPLCACGGMTRVIDSRSHTMGKYRKRDRACVLCGRPMVTYELRLTAQLVELLHDHGLLLRVEE